MVYRTNNCPFSSWCGARIAMFVCRERHIAPTGRLTVVALTNANSLCGIIRILCNPNEFVWHQSRYCAVARAHPRDTRPISQRSMAE
jgi:hypothetical protein